MTDFDLVRRVIDALGIDAEDLPELSGLPDDPDEVHQAISAFGAMLLHDMVQSGEIPKWERYTVHYDPKRLPDLRHMVFEVVFPGEGTLMITLDPNDPRKVLKREPIELFGPFLGHRQKTGTGVKQRDAGKAARDAAIRAAAHKLRAARPSRYKGKPLARLIRDLLADWRIEWGEEPLSERQLREILKQ